MRGCRCRCATRRADRRATPRGSPRPRRRRDERRPHVGDADDRMQREAADDHVDRRQLAEHAHRRRDRRRSLPPPRAAPSAPASRPGSVAPPGRLIWPAWRARPLARTVSGTATPGLHGIEQQQRRGDARLDRKVPGAPARPCGDGANASAPRARAASRPAARAVALRVPLAAFAIVCRFHRRDAPRRSPNIAAWLPFPRSMLRHGAQVLDWCAAARSTTSSWRRSAACWRAAIPTSSICRAGCPAASRCERPIVSANMDTVTRAPMAIVQAEEGGIGIIDRGFRPGEIEPQVREVEIVKRTQHGVITDPYSIAPGAALAEARGADGALARRHAGRRRRRRRLLGLLTERDVRFVDASAVDGRRSHDAGRSAGRASRAARLAGRSRSG